jgi:hypothetical protein
MRAYAAWRVGRTRFGATLAVEQEDNVSLSSPRQYGSVRGSGPSGRLGGVVGWGAPWNDLVIGFLGEGGLALGEVSGSARSRPPAALVRESEGTLSVTTSYVSAYAGAWMILQVPWRLPVRPVAGLGVVWVPNVPDPAPVLLMADLGFVWQAW